MIAEVCAVYGWTVQYVLSMPARQFYVMAKQARFIRYRTLVDEVDIARISWGDTKYTDGLQSMYVRQATDGQKAIDDPIPVDPQIATGMIQKPKELSAADKERTKAALSLACMIKKGHHVRA